MSNEYDIYIEAKSLSDLVDDVSKSLGVTLKEWKDSQFSANTEWFAISVESFDDELWQEELESDYGLKPSLVVSFQVYPQIDGSHSEMIRLMNSMIKLGYDRQILLFNGETPLVKYDKGRTTFNRAWEEESSIDFKVFATSCDSYFD